jgi:hypothetical protein
MAEELVGERLTKEELIEEIAHLSDADRFELGLIALAFPYQYKLKQVDKLQAAFSVAARCKPKAECALDVTPFRERYLILHARDKLTADEVAGRLGWYYGNGSAPKGDGTRLKRRLGLEADVSGGHRYSVARHLSRETAADLCPALDIDPVDIRGV